MLPKELTMKLHYFILKPAAITALFLFFISFSHAQTPVADFDDLQNAISSPSVNSVVFNTPKIDFSDNLNFLYDRTVEFSQNHTPVNFDGKSAYRGFSAYDSSSLSFNDIVLSNMKTPSLSNTAETNYGAAFNLFSSKIAVTGNASFQNNKALSGGALHSSAGAFNFHGQTSFNSNSATLKGGAAALYNGSSAYFGSGALFAGNSAAAGGALFLSESSLSSYGGSSFNGNKASLNGGAFSGENHSLFEFYGQAHLQDNSAQEKGGGFCLNASDAEFFDSARVENNSALMGGGFAAEGKSAVSFDSQAAINSNTASLNGGGFYSNDAAVVFWDKTEIKNNISSGKGGGFCALNNSLILGYAQNTVTGNKASGDGGGFYAANASGVSLGKSDISNNESGACGGGFASDSSEVYFDYEAKLSSNKAFSNGGAFFAANGSKVTFERSSDFNGNNAGNDGGGLYCNSSFLSFDSNAAFASNSASGNGGAFALLNGSDARFGSGSSFKDNSSQKSGGAIYAENSSFGLQADEGLFSGNSARQNGGAVYLKGAGSCAFVSGNSSFINNSADNGGAVFVDSADGFKLQGKNNSFTSNKAGNSGGALFINSSKVSLLNPSFTDNIAEKSGGAVFIQGSKGKNASLDIDVFSAAAVFKGNLAGGKSNALHIGDYSSVNFNVGNGASVEMRDGITGAGVESYFSYSGDGDFNFYGDASGNLSDITLNAQNGAAFNLMRGAKLSAGNVKNTLSSVFNMKNGQADRVQVKHFSNAGAVNMEVFSSLNDNDKIVSSGDVTLENGSVLNVYDDFADGNFRSKTFRLINYTGALNGTFGSVNFNSPTAFPSNPLISYGGFLANWITVTYRGNLNATGFGALSGLFFNQKETAKTFDKLSLHSAGDLDAVISAVEAGSDKSVRKALSESSGYFLANVIRSAAAGSQSNELYSRIKNHCSFGQISGGLWAQFTGSADKFFADGNSPRDYKDFSKGIMAGYDMYSNGKVIGFYGKYNSHDVKQNPANEAEIINAGAGIYGGIVKYKWELKGSLSGSYDDYCVKRDIAFLKRKAESDFKGLTLGADIETALKFNIMYRFIISPFAGMEIKNTRYDGFKEKKAESMNLSVKKGNYSRSAARAGIGASYERKFIDFYVNGQVKYLLGGEFPEINSSFQNTKTEFRSRGAEEDRTALGAAAGISFRIAEPLKIFANTDYFAASAQEFFYMNIGMRYNFCNLRLRKKIKPDTAKDGFSYAPPPDLNAPDTSDAAEEEQEQKEEQQQQPSEPEKTELSDDFFDSLIYAVEHNINDKMQEALSGDDTGNRQNIISIELIRDFSDGGEGGGSGARKYILNMSNFLSNKAELTEKAKNNLIFIANEIQLTDYKSIKIEGHTDSTGNDMINDKLSLERAKAVYDIFIRTGIPPEKMSYEGLSSKHPASTNKTKEGRAKNRRVEILIN